MATCRNCSQTIQWPQPYQKGNKPQNLDGTAHNCLSGGQNHSPDQQGFNPEGQPIQQPQSNPNMSRLDVKFEEIDKLDQMLFDVSTKRLEAIKKTLGIDMIPIGESIVFIESWSRTLAQTLR